MKDKGNWKTFLTYFLLLSLLLQIYELGVLMWQFWEKVKALYIAVFTPVVRWWNLSNAEMQRILQRVKTLYVTYQSIIECQYSYVYFEQ